LGSPAAWPGAASGSGADLSPRRLIDPKENDGDNLSCGFFMRQPSVYAFQEISRLAAHLQHPLAAAGFEARKRAFDPDEHRGSRPGLSGLVGSGVSVVPFSPL